MSTPPLPPLTLRRATPSDLPLLTAMRRACGWGESDLPARFAAVEAGAEVLYVFGLEGEGAGQGEVGMGAVVFEGDKERTTSREQGRVMISRLFLYPEYHGRAYGNQMMALLEHECFATFAARSITLSVMAFEPFTARSIDEAEGLSRNRLWYRRLGYVEFRDPLPMHDYPPGPKLMTSLMEKQAPTIDVP